MNENIAIKMMICEYEMNLYYEKDSIIYEAYKNTNFRNMIDSYFYQELYIHLVWMNLYYK